MWLMTYNIKLIEKINSNSNSLKNMMKSIVNLLKEVGLRTKLTKMWNIENEIDLKKYWEQN